mmetsp:Transcript_28858/g.48976  ORF Transcript_28858/g.48976 Transcript_28858/m.48976 type:complete len:222 (+) Transcript_28858:136-801(+)
MEDVELFGSLCTLWLSDILPTSFFLPKLLPEDLPHLYLLGILNFPGLKLNLVRLLRDFIRTDVRCLCLIRELSKSLLSKSLYQCRLRVSKLRALLDFSLPEGILEEAVDARGRARAFRKPYHLLPYWGRVNGLLFRRFDMFSLPFHKLILLPCCSASAPTEQHEVPLIELPLKALQASRDSPRLLPREFVDNYLPPPGLSSSSSSSSLNCWHGDNLELFLN